MASRNQTPNVIAIYGRRKSNRRRFDFRRRKHYTHLKGADMNKHARLLPIYLLAFATVMYGQAPGAAPARGGAQGQQGQQRAQLTYDFNDHEGWKQLFDGRTLSGWDGPTSVWRVEDGAIVGESTVEHPTIWYVDSANTGTSYIIPKTGKLKNFEFKTEMLVTQGTNSGIQFRATRLGAIPDAVYAAQLEKRIPADGPKVRPNLTAWENRGYQIDLGYNANGGLIDCCKGPQRGVGQMDFGNNPQPPRSEGRAGRGQAVRSGGLNGSKPELFGIVGDPTELASHFKVGDWNQIQIIANGNVLMGIVNGQLMDVWIDEDPKLSNPEGEIALQLEGRGNVKVMFRNIWIRTLP
jgi:hypothetical protein